MKQRFLSGLIVLTLMASVISGAMGVSLRSVKADGESVLYFDDFCEYVYDLETFDLSSQSVKDSMVAFLNTCKTYLEDSSKNVLIMRDGVNFSLLVISPSSGQTLTTGGYVQNNSQYWYMRDTSWYGYCQCFGFLKGNSTSLTLNTSPGSFLGRERNSIVNLTNLDYNQAYFTPYEIGTYETYCSRNLSSESGYNGYSFSANLLSGSAPPQYDEINLVTFNVGIKRFLTVDDQDYVQGMDPEKEGYTWAFFGLDKDGNDFDRVLSDTDLVVVPNANFYTDELFNLATYGALCWELPDELDVIANSGFGVRNVLGQIDDLVAVCINCPYWINEELPTEEKLQDEQYMQAFNTFNTYVESYNTTHVIPENLADTLYGLNGSKLYPCSVSVPKSVWNNNSSGASNQLSDQHNWKWWFSSRTDLGMNFELMDVVILSESANGQYSLLYYYSDSLNNPFQYVQNLSLQDLFENFDIVILVPDDLGCLKGNTWWKQLLESICQNLGISNLSSDLLSSLAVSGSDSLGVEFVDSQPSDVAGVLQGFCIVTKKAIQRQQLYVFNDGITKTYKLMSDYIENRGKWEDSFLLWTASLFSQWQSLDGKLGNIYNLLYGWNLSSVLSDISESLARIANNTSEEDPGYWFLSLFNWLNRFSVTDSDFANWVSEYDDFTDDLPDPGTGATVIPFPTAIPTVAVGG